MSFLRVATLSRQLSSPARRLTLLSSHFRPAFRTMASSSVPKTQSGILIEKTGGTDVLQWKTDIPVPDLSEGQVLVKNEYIGINYIDT